MKISTKGEYGLRAMLYIAAHAETRQVTSHEIARHQGIPEPYLRQILAQLSKEGLVASSRGPQGGHSLARPAKDITLKSILMTLEGQTTGIDQILALPCNIEVGVEHCAIREVFLRVKSAVERILTETTLQQLADRQGELIERNIRVPLDVGLEAIGSPLLPVLSD